MAHNDKAANEETEQQVPKDQIILTFGQGHVPQFNNNFTHLVMTEKTDPELYAQQAPTIQEVLAMDCKVVLGADLRFFDVKQLIHTPNGQYLVAIYQGATYLLIPGCLADISV